MLFTRSIGYCSLVACAAFALAGETTAYTPRPKGELTYTKHIAPIVFQNCAACHRPGEVAPFSLLTYQDIRKRAEQIADVADRRIMPPWKPVAGHGEFLDARTLTPEQIGMIHQWAEEGAAEGDPADLPAPPKFTPGWQLGQPDLIVTMPEVYEAPAEGRDIYRNFVLPLTIPPGKYISAVEYRPGNRKLVHHAILSYDTTGRAREQDAKDPGPGFTNFSIVGKRLPGSAGFWTPGKNFYPLGEGFSFDWPEKAELVLQLHVHPSGKPETEQSTIGVYLTDEAPQRKRIDVTLIDAKIDIPPGEAAYRTHAEVTVQGDVEAYAVFPHMHMIGKEVKLVAELPDGEKRNLLWINDWNFNWQDYYHYATPVKLPKGTKLTMDCVHDNSALNPSNPSNPPKRVRWGEQTLDEMSIVLVEVVPTSPVEGSVVKRTPPSAQELESRIDAALKAFDKDADGKLSVDEIATATAGKQPRDVLEKVVTRFDKDGDGKLNKDEAIETVRTLAGR